MSKNSRKSFSPEIKAHSVERVKTSGLPLAQVAHDLELPASELERWVNEAEACNENSLETRLERLREEARLLRMEVEILKRAEDFMKKKGR